MRSRFTPVELAKDLEPVLPSQVRRAVQRIVERFGDIEEIAVALHHVPAGIQSQFPHQRQNARQQLRHPAAHRRGIHHIHGGPFQRLRQRPQFVHFRRAQQRHVLIQRGSLRFH